VCYSTELKQVEFLAPGGVGEKLQSQLIQRANDKRNWLEVLVCSNVFIHLPLQDWWYSRAYLIWRCPIPITSNYYFLFNENITKSVSQSRQAARFVMGILLWRQMLEKESIPPEFMRGGQTPLCMHQFSKYAFVPLFLFL